MQHVQRATNLRKNLFCVLRAQHIFAHIFLQRATAHIFQNAHAQACIFKIIYDARRALNIFALLLSLPQALIGASSARLAGEFFSDKRLCKFWAALPANPSPAKHDFLRLAASRFLISFNNFILLIALELL